MTKEAIFHGVRCGVIHPGYTDTPMVHALGEEFIHKRILPYTQLRRLIRPEEIADAICFMIGNSAVSGQLWADAGWHPLGLMIRAAQNGWYRRAYPASSARGRAKLSVARHRNSLIRDRPSPGVLAMAALSRTRSTDLSVDPCTSCYIGRTAHVEQINR